MRYITTVGEKEFLVEILDESHIIVDGQTIAVDFETIAGQPVYSLLLDGTSYETTVYEEEGGWQVLLHGRSYQVQVIDEREKRLRSAAGGGVGERAEYHLKAPMPGLVVAVQVQEGQKIEKGEVLVLLELMKMQNELKSPRAGTVTRLRIQAGVGVEQNQTLLTVI